MKPFYLIFGTVTLIVLWLGFGGYPSGIVQGSGDQAGLQARKKVYSTAEKGFVMKDKVKKTKAEWKQQLTPEQYEITREKATERAFTGRYWDHHEKGVYRCVACGNELFGSETKFDSGTGWPSFSAPIAKENVRTEADNSLLMLRTAVLCGLCDAHLGHVFDDGPKPTGLRYCLNSAALTFAKSK